MLSNSKTRLIFLLCLFNLYSLTCGRMVNWYFNTRDYSRQCYCSMYTSSCFPNGCAKNGPCSTPYPSTYVAQHLNGQTITVDGQLDDPAWKEVKWSSLFKDIRGDKFPRPRHNTRFKIRWDDENMYLAFMIGAEEIWGTYTKDESHMFNENAIEFFFAPDETLQNYKEIQGSVRNVTWDLMLTKAYIDGGVARDRWSAGGEKGVTHDGVINDPKNKGTFWTTEWALPFQNLADDSIRNQSAPLNNEVFFVQFGRVEHPLKVRRKQYVKDDKEKPEWWAWEPTEAVNMHIPSRWGLVQFSRSPKEKFDFKRWHIYRTLFAVFDSLVQFKAMNGIYSSDLLELPVPRYIYSRLCIKLPVITLTGGGFEISVTSRVLNETGTILQDRSVSFTKVIE